MTEAYLVVDLNDVRQNGARPLQMIRSRNMFADLKSIKIFENTIDYMK